MGAKGWLSSLDLLPEFGRRLRHHWAAAVMGGTLPGIVLFVWSLFGSLPHWTVGLILVGALLFSGYFTWRDEYVARQQNEQKIRVKISFASVVDGGTSTTTVGSPEPMTPVSSHLGMHVTLSVFNAGPPTVLDDWELALPDGSVAVAFDTTETRVKNSWPRARSADQFRLINNVKELADTPLATGQRKELLLEFQSADLDIAKADELKKEGLPWTLMFRDASGVRYKVNLVRRGYVYEQIEDASTDLTPIRHLV
jgi:hypothetical protein